MSISLCVYRVCVCVDMYDGHVLCMYILSTTVRRRSSGSKGQDAQLAARREEDRRDKDKKKMNRTMMSNHDMHEMMTVNYYN